MSHDIQTPGSQTDSPADESAQSNQAPSGTNGGFDSVATQYRAMQEAQLLHEETINQLREEVRGQREKLAELARTSPSAKTGQVDIVMMRLTELERKIGEGAPDPLINEIVHRLAALENDGPMRGAKDPRVDEVYKQLDSLRQKVDGAKTDDSRTDDVVLRIASLEAAFRRAAQSRDPEEVQARIDSLAEELNDRQEAELAELRNSLAEAARAASEAAEQSAGDSVSASALEALTERLSTVEQQLGGLASQEQLTAFGEQLAQLDRKLAEQPADEPNTALDEITNRVEAVEQKLAEQPAAESGTAALDEIANRVEAVEQKLTERPEDEPNTAVLEEIANRVDAIERKLESSSDDGTSDQLKALETKLAGLESSPEVATLQQRVESLTSQIAESDTPHRLLELSGRLRSLENRLEEQPDKSEETDQLSRRLANFELELQSIKADARPPAEAASAPSNLVERLDELENRISEVESSSRLEDAHTRLKTIEDQWAALGDPTDIGRRLTVLEMDDKAVDPRVAELAQRVAAFEEKPLESASDSRLEQLNETVTELRTQLETVSRDSASALAELPARLARLEAQVREIPAPGAVESGESATISLLQSNLQNLGLRLDELANQSATPTHDPRVSELVARVEWVERKASSLPDSSDAGLEELKERLARLEQAQTGGGGEEMSPGVRAEIASRLNAIEEALSAQGSQGVQQTSDIEGALRQETERLNQWARSTIDEIGELRARIDSLSSSSGSGSGLDAEAVEALGVQISNGLNTSEVKSLRGQMYFVYLSIGVLFALVLYLLVAG